MAAYLLQTGSAFTIDAGAKFATLDIGVISGEVTIGNDFYDARVWGDESSGMTEGRGAYQAIGHVRGFHDSVAVAAILADFEPTATLSIITMTFQTTPLRRFKCSANIHNVHIVGDRQKPGPVEITWDFKSVGDLTAVEI